MEPLIGLRLRKVSLEFFSGGTIRKTVSQRAEHRMNKPLDRIRADAIQRNRNSALANQINIGLGYDRRKNTWIESLS
jgi:hypothetical protein